MEPKAVIKDRGASRVRSGHPWVYRSDVASASGEAGDVVYVTDRRGAPVGQAFFNPRSEIALRIATREDEPVDQSWFHKKLREALAYRLSMEIDADAYRVVHAEADGVPGLVVDRYGEYLVVQVGSAAVERRLGWVVSALEDLLAPSGILLRADSYARKREGLDTKVRSLSGEVPESLVVREGPVSYRAFLWKGQKTGSFLDQRENHLAAGRFTGEGDRVLDVFSYAGGFALHAAQKAASVEAVDSSGAALDAARANVAINGLSNVTFTRKNAFDLLRERADSGELYDAVILDPPAFARSRRDLPGAIRAYKEINLRAIKLLMPGGVLVTCSCSYHFSRELMQDTLRSAASDAGATMRVREWRSQAADHPEVLTIPETRYLKCAILDRLR